MDEKFAERYEVLETYSGSGVLIYKAIDRSFDRVVAIKTPDDKTLGTAEKLKSFVEEGRLLAKFDHANIISVFNFHEIGQFDQRCYLVSPWMDISLEEILTTEDLSVPAVTEIFLKVLEGVRALHNEGIIHRDLKPANIFLSQNRQQVKVGDLGIASCLDQHGTLDQEQLTPKYLAPEMFDETTLMGRRSDIYSLGMMAYEMFLGRRGFEQAFQDIYSEQDGNGSNMRWLNWHQDPFREATPLIEVDVEINPKLSQLVSLMMSKTIDSRPTDIEMIISEFRSAMGEQAVTLPYKRLEPAQREMTQRSIYRRPWFITSLSLVMIFIVTLAFILIGAEPSVEKRVAQLMEQVSKNRNTVINMKLHSIDADSESEYALAEASRAVAMQHISDKNWKSAEPELNKSLIAYVALLDAEIAKKLGLIRDLKLLIKEVEVENTENLDAGLKHELQGKELRQENLYQQASFAYDKAIAVYSGILTILAAKELLVEVDNLIESLGTDSSLKQSAEYKQGIAYRSKGYSSLAARRYDQAIIELEQARDALDASQATEKRAIVAKLGSSEEQISAAMILCQQYAEHCDRAWYASETIRDVRLTPFALDWTEVSNKRFLEFVQATGYVSDAEKRGYSYKVLAGRTVRAQNLNWQSMLGESLESFDEPVSNVSQQDASAYCEYVGKRLPTADEWEYTARGGTTKTQYPWGDEWRPKQVVWAETSQGKVWGVQGAATKQTTQGHYHLLGNVWEWTSSKSPEGYLLKGGSWAETNPANLRPAAATVAGKSDSSDDFGFRCASDTGHW